jgi:hypothetical protein
MWSLPKDVMLLTEGDTLGAGYVPTDECSVKPESNPALQLTFMVTSMSVSVGSNDAGTVMTESHSVAVAMGT